MEVSKEILDSIPQRPPFLFVDQIVEVGRNSIHTRKYLSGEEDFFKGHFPGDPIMPGVLLQEAAFQTGALLISQMEDIQGLGVVTRVDNVKFKGMVRPNDTLDIKVELLESLSNAYHFLGKIYLKEKLVARLNFSCGVI